MTGPDGEYEVIAWINELGVRHPSFSAFLEWILELGQQDHADLTAPAVPQTAPSLARTA